MPGEPVPTRGACGQAGQPFPPLPPFSAARSRTSASKDLVSGPSDRAGPLVRVAFPARADGRARGERGRFPVMDTSHSRPSGDRDTLCVRSQPRKRGQNKSPCEQDAFQQNTYVQRHKMINNLPHTRLTKVFWKYQFLEVCLF